MVREQALQQLRVEAVHGGHRVEDGVLRGELQHHRNRAVLEVGVDEHHWTRGVAGKGDGEVGRDDGLADAPLGGEDGDHRAELGVRLGR